MNNLKQHLRTLTLTKTAGKLFYKSACSILLLSRLRKLRKITAKLPEVPPHLRISDDKGFLIVNPDLSLATFPTLCPLMDCCLAIMKARANENLPQHGDKYQMADLISDRELEKYPQFIDFALDPLILALVTDYLKTAPALFKIYFWWSHATDGPIANSQLYHMDHEDIRQLKIFLFLSDVDDASGPLTIIPAESSESLRKQIHYQWCTKVPDEQIRPHIPPAVEQPLLGPRGTLAFVDTSRVFHFGSRVTDKNRYVVVFQYLSPTHLFSNPLKNSRTYPYAALAARVTDEIGKVVLGGH